MMLANPVFHRLCDELTHALGAEAVSIDSADCRAHAADWSGLHEAEPRAVVRPHSTTRLPSRLSSALPLGSPSSSKVVAQDSLGVPVRKWER